MGCDGRLCISEDKMKLYRTTIQVEVLSEGEYEFGGLRAMAFDVIEGDCSAMAKVTQVEELTREQMATALLDQGSDPEFLGCGEGD